MTDDTQALRDELEVLRKQEETYRFLAESAQDFLYLVGPDMRLRFVNRAGAGQFQSTPEALVGKHIRELFPTTAERQIQSLQKVLSTGEPLFTEYPYQVAGREIWLNARLMPVKNDAGQVIAVAGTSLDITHHKQAEQLLEQRVKDRTRELEQEVAERRRAEVALRESEERFKKFFESSPLPVSIHSREDWRFVEVNLAFLEITGMTREEVIGKPAPQLDLLPDASLRLKRELQLQEKGCVRNLEGRIRTKSGEVRHGIFNVDTFTLQDRKLYFVTMQDITERKRLEQQVVQTQKLESLGVMAGGIAHDFNNLLVGVIGKAELALLELPAGSASRARIEEIQAAANRLSELTSQMLAFSGKGRFLREPINLSAAVREMVHLVDPSIPRHIERRLELPEFLPAIQADAGQVRQVILNLITNAAEAIGDRLGQLNVRAGEILVSAHTAQESFFHDPVQPGPFVFLEVTDTGGGIERQILEHIFDPFFSTKFTGRGLGLAAVAGIMRSHGGLIQVSSEPGRGTTFRVLFPRTTDPVTQVAAPPLSPALRAASVLVVDDDEIVREVARSFLEKAGFSVLIATNGQAAVELVRKQPDGVQLVLLDLTMPQMDGIEAAIAIDGIRKGLPVILSSGYPEQHAAARCRGLTMAGFIQKPYEYKTLISLVQSILSHNPQG